MKPKELEKKLHINFEVLGENKEGPFALVCICSKPIVTFYLDAREARRDFDLASAHGCGNTCKGDHRILVG